MAVKDIASLKEKFESGDMPTQQDFIDLIDSFVHVMDMTSFPNPLPAVSGENLENIPLPDPLPAIGGQNLIGISVSEWQTVEGDAIAVDATHFNLPGDLTVSLVPGRKLKLIKADETYHISRVVTASYNATLDITAVEVDTVLPTPLPAVVYVAFLSPSDQGGTIDPALNDVVTTQELSTALAGKLNTISGLSAFELLTADDDGEGPLVGAGFSVGDVLRASLHKGVGGLTQHPAATTLLSGFMSPTDKSKLDALGTIAVLVGTITHGGTIPLPSGYTEGQCKWKLSPRSGWNTSNFGGYEMHAEGTRVVTSQFVYNDGGGSTWVGCTATYMIIGVK
ncbi:MAG: hypothetical protein RPU39_13755 [Candidatus Sedimenticola sp. (ex Thyasira tokunagai)]